MKKKGISLIVLIVTIAILLILLGAITITVGNSINNSRISSFANDLLSIEDAVNVYYIQNGEFPVLLENEMYVEYIYNTSNLVAKDTKNNEIILNEEYIDTFKQELILNSDLTDGENVVSDTVFYKIDLNKINVEKTSRGTGKNGDNDIYIMAYPSQTIYYLKGLVVDKKAYFSIVNLIEYEGIINDKKLASDTTQIVQETAGILVKREKKAWTNTLDIIIDSYLEDLENLYIYIPVRDEHIKLATVPGQNIINLKTLDGSLGLTKDEMVAFDNLESSKKYLVVIKKQGTIELGSIKISLSNYETEPPVIPLKNDGSTLDFNIISNEGENIVSFSAKDNISGIKEVRYVYIKEFNEKGIPQAIYKNEDGKEIIEFTSEYMLENGKKAYVSSTGKVNINLPKDIEAIYIVMYDKAGNNIHITKNVTTDIYAGINLKNITNDLIFEYVIRSDDNIISAKTWISEDKVTFTDEKNLNLVKNSDGIYIGKLNYNYPNSKELYLKIIVESESKTETRIKKIDISKKAYELMNSVVPGIIYNENKYYTDSNGDMAILPSGFKVSSKLGEQTINDGLVILDKNDNEYVWVPCTVDGANGSIKYEKWNGSRNTDYTVTKEQVGDDTLPSGVLNEKDQIEKYSGFYIARYEASLPDELTTEEMMLTKTFNATDNNRTDIGKAQSKSDKIVWNNINYNNAKIVSENVISNKYVQSGLVTGTQWDTMLKFLSEEVDVDSNCISWGNYFNKYGYTINGYYKNKRADIAYINGEYTKLNEGYLLLTTGKFGNVVEEGSPKNLFDVVGNVWEWSAETVIEKGGQYTAVGNKLLRGGGCNHYGSNVASYRESYNADTITAPDVGFRFVLYIK